MSTNPAIPEQSGTIIPPQKPRKSLKAKYDKRIHNGAHLRTLPQNQPGASKPSSNSKWIKALKGYDSFKVLREIDSIASCTQIYALAFELKLLPLCWSIRESVENRALGKPFVAINPQTTEQPHTLVQDNRLQVAITQMLPSKDKKAASLQAQTTPELTQSASLAAIPVRK